MRWARVYLDMLDEAEAEAAESDRSKSNSNLTTPDGSPLFS